MKLIFSILLLISFNLHAQKNENTMNATNAVKENQKAVDFKGTTIQNKSFSLSEIKGKKILLSFFRNGACALCNLRVHELIQRKPDLDAAGIEMVAVFESPIEDMVPYVGKQHVPFTLLSDPNAKIYALYNITTSEKIIQEVMASGSAKPRVAEAAKAGFNSTQQENANFYRIPAEILIDENFNIIRIHHCDQLVNHMPIDEILEAFSVANATR
jgi:thioredoxin-dependent peroxiredoxin